MKLAHPRSDSTWRAVCNLRAAIRCDSNSLQSPNTGLRLRCRQPTCGMSAFQCAKFEQALLRTICLSAARILLAASSSSASPCSTIPPPLHLLQKFAGCVIRFGSTSIGNLRPLAQRRFFESFSTRGANQSRTPTRPPNREISERLHATHLRPVRAVLIARRNRILLSRFPCPHNRQFRI